jgi:T-complex protein 1 subunit eta
MRHARGETWAGVDISSESIADNFENFVWEPALVKTNAIKSATEAATMIVSIDETIKAEQSQQPQAGPQMSRGQAQQVLRGMGRGRGMPRR